MNKNLNYKSIFNAIKINRNMERYLNKKKFNTENNYSQFHAISIKEERARTEITVVPVDIPNIIIEIRSAKIYVPANEMLY